MVATEGDQTWLPAKSPDCARQRVTGVLSDVAAIVGVVEIDTENLQGTFIRKQLVALMLSRGAVWTLNCGATDFDSAKVRSRYDELSPVFGKILGSFAFLATPIAVPPAGPPSWTQAQIKQVEKIALDIAAQHNANAQTKVDRMTASTRAIAIGRNVRIENVLRVKKGLPPGKLQEFSDETQREVVPASCAANSKNPAFERGLSYTFAYSNTYGEKLAEFTVDEATCRGRE